MVNLDLLTEQGSIQRLQQTVNRLFAIQDFEGAVPVCEELCSEVSKVDGELGDRCAEPYYQYATALLELAREENQLLAQSKLGEGEEDEEGEAEPSEPITAQETGHVTSNNQSQHGTQAAPAEHNSAPSSTSNGVSTSQPPASSTSQPQLDSNLVDSTAVELSNSHLTSTTTLATPSNNNTDNTSSTSSTTPSNNTPSTSSTAPSNNTPSTSAADSSIPDHEEEEEEEDVTSLQIAWEVLELARVIYTRQTNSADNDSVDNDRQIASNESCTKLARVEVKLGEVCMENEKMGEAIEHFELAIETFIKGGCDAYSKDISSTYYLMGLAASLDQNYQTAKEHYSKCVQIMSASIMQLQSLEKSGDREKEISSLCEMKAEVQRMVQDCADSLKQMEQYNVIKQALAPMIQAAASSKASSSSAQPSSSSAQPSSSSQPFTASSGQSSISNISHLVRKASSSTPPASSSTPPASSSTPPSSSSTPPASSSTPPASSPTVSSSSQASGKATLQVSPLVSSTSSLRSSFPQPSAVSSSLDRRMGSSTSGFGTSTSGFGTSTSGFGTSTSGFGSNEAQATLCPTSTKPLVSKSVKPIQRSDDITSSSDITSKRSSELSDQSNEAKRRKN